MAKAQTQRGIIGGETIPIGRGAFIALGIMLMVVGTVSLVFPMIAALSFNLLVGATLLAGGTMTLVHAFGLRGWRGFGAEVLLALLYIGAGLIFVLDPFAGLITLTVLLGAFFAADGIARIMLAFRIRPLGAWWLFLLSGALSLVLGVLVLIGVPGGTSFAFLGLLIGINMILTGLGFLFCAAAERAAR